MTGSECLTDWKRRNEITLQHLTNIANHHGEQEFYQRSAPVLWNAAQIVEHMVIVNRVYFQEIEGGIKRAEKAAGSALIRHTFFGRLLIRAAGPNGNAPSPKVFLPSQNPNWREVFAEWQEQHTRLIALLDQAAAADLSGTYVKNPVVRVIPMNLADCLEVLTAHAERHIGQIQERIFSRSPTKAT